MYTAQSTGNIPQELLNGLNQDLANEYAAMIQYLYQSAVVSGVYRPVFETFFASQIEDETRHARFLAAKIASLGGQPTVQPAPVNPSRDLIGMLRANLEAERATIHRYRQRLQQADAIGDVGLRVTLEEFIADETRHAEELQQIMELTGSVAMGQQVMTGLAAGPAPTQPFGSTPGGAEPTGPFGWGQPGPFA